MSKIPEITNFLKQFSTSSVILVEKNELKDMSKILDVFPLFPISIIVFPGEIQPLHIFEPRYKQLIGEMETSQGFFGIPYIKDGEMCMFGSLVSVHKILAKSPTGEMDILVRGAGIFMLNDIEERLPGKLYGGGKITILNEMNHTVTQNLYEKYRFYRIQLEKSDPSVFSGIAVPSQHRILDIAGQLPLQTEEKYSIIKFEENTQREEFLMKKLDFLLMINQKLEEVGYRFYLN